MPSPTQYTHTQEVLILILYSCNTHDDEYSMSAGALSSFIPEGRERRQVMEAVGDACEQQGQMEAARELYLAAPNPCAALRIINRQLSDLTKPAITDQAASKPATASQVSCDSISPSLHVWHLQSP